MRQILQKFSLTSIFTGFALTTIVPSGVAQLPITGGRITGEAGFFVPNVGNTKLFDFGTRTLRLETPNGVTVDSRFAPTSGGIDPIGNRLPRTGDQGFLEGSLSGRAFDLGGNPVFFSNVGTRLNFVTNSFSPTTGTLAGSLIFNPNQLDAQLFLPVLGVTLDPVSALSFAVQPGTLAVGRFDAALPSGGIALPNTVRFGTPLVTEFAIPDAVFSTERRLNFSLKGSAIPNPVGTIGDPLGSFFDPFFAGGVRFSSNNAVTNFSVQLEGTNLAITGSGNFGTLIEIQGITPGSSAASPILPGNLVPVVQYSVVGNGSGSVTNSDPLQFRSDNSATVFSFTDSAGAFANGVSAGRTQFTIAGAQPFTVSSFTSLTPTLGTTSYDISNKGVFVPANVIPPLPIVATGGIPGQQQAQTTSTPISITPQQQINLVFFAPNPNVPGSVVFPGLDFTQQSVTTTIPGNSDPLRRLLNGENLTVSDLLALGPGINNFVNSSTQSIPVDSSSTAFTNLLGPGTIPTDNRLNIDLNSTDISTINPNVAPTLNMINSIMAPLSRTGVINTGSVEQINEFTRQQQRATSSAAGPINADIAWNSTMTSIKKRDAEIQIKNQESAARMAEWRAKNGMDP